MTPRTSFKPKHWPSADQRNRSYDRRRNALRLGVIFLIGMILGFAVKLLL